MSPGLITVPSNWSSSLRTVPSIGEVSFTSSTWRVSLITFSFKLCCFNVRSFNVEFFSLNFPEINFSCSKLAFIKSKEFSSLSISVFFISETSFLSRCSRLFNSVVRLCISSKVEAIWEVKYLSKLIFAFSRSWTFFSYSAFGSIFAANKPLDRSTSFCDSVICPLRSESEVWISAVLLLKYSKAGLFSSNEYGLFCKKARSCRFTFSLCLFVLISGRTAFFNSSRSISLFRIARSSFTSRPEIFASWSSFCICISLTWPSKTANWSSPAGASNSLSRIKFNSAFVRVMSVLVAANSSFVLRKSDAIKVSSNSASAWPFTTLSPSFTSIVLTTDEWLDWTSTFGIDVRIFPRVETVTSISAKLAQTPKDKTMAIITIPATARGFFGEIFANSSKSSLNSRRTFCV